MRRKGHTNNLTQTSNSSPNSRSEKHEHTWQGVFLAQSLAGNRKQNGFGDFTVIQGVKVVVRPIVGHERDVGGESRWQRSVGCEAIDAWFDCGVL